MPDINVWWEVAMFLAGIASNAAVTLLGKHQRTRLALGLFGAACILGAFGLILWPTIGEALWRVVLYIVAGLSMLYVYWDAFRRLRRSEHAREEAESKAETTLTNRVAELERSDEPLTCDGLDWSVVEERVSPKGLYQSMVNISPAGSLPQPLKLRVRTSAPSTSAGLVRFYQDSKRLNPDTSAKITVDSFGPDLWVTLTFPKLREHALLAVLVQAETYFEVDSVLRTTSSADPQSPRIDS